MAEGFARNPYPVISTGVEPHHWPLPDPADLIIKFPETIQAFHLVRHQFEQNVKALLLNTCRDFLRRGPVEGRMP